MSVESIAAFRIVAPKMKSEVCRRCAQQTIEKRERERPSNKETHQPKETKSKEKDRGEIGAEGPEERHQQGETRTGTRTKDSVSSQPEEDEPADTRLCHAW